MDDEVTLDQDPGAPGRNIEPVFPLEASPRSVTPRALLVRIIIIDRATSSDRPRTHVDGSSSTSSRVRVFRAKSLLHSPRRKDRDVSSLGQRANRLIPPSRRFAGAAVRFTSEQGHLQSAHDTVCDTAIEFSGRTFASRILSGLEATALFKGHLGQGEALSSLVGQCSVASRPCGKGPGRGRLYVSPTPVAHFRHPQLELGRDGVVGSAGSGVSFYLLHSFWGSSVRLLSAPASSAPQHAQTSNGSVPRPSRCSGLDGSDSSTTSNSNTRGNTTSARLMN